LPDLHIYYVRRKGRKHENYTAAADEAFNVLFEKVWNWYEDPFALMRLGIIRDLELIPLEERRFDAALVIPEQVPRIPLKELHRDRLPGGRFAIFTHKGPYDSLWQTWSRIYRNWYPLSGLTLRDTPSIRDLS
jgi:AraC family transcriptional regulator